MQMTEEEAESFTRSVLGVVGRAVGCAEAKAYKQKCSDKQMKNTSASFVDLLPAAKKRRLEEYRTIPKVQQWLSEGREVAPWIHRCAQCLCLLMCACVCVCAERDAWFHSIFFEGCQLGTTPGIAPNRRAHLPHASAHKRVVFVAAEGAFDWSGLQLRCKFCRAL